MIPTMKGRCHGQSNEGSNPARLRKFCSPILGAPRFSPYRSLCSSTVLASGRVTGFVIGDFSFRRFTKNILATSAPSPPVELAPAIITAVVEMHTGHIVSSSWFQKDDERPGRFRTAELTFLEEITPSLGREKPPPGPLPARHKLAMPFRARAPSPLF
jgi:hypothetical protein